MSIELYFSNQLKQLGQKLSENLRDEGIVNENVFLPSTIIVPNRNLKKWLQMTVSNNIGIAANIDFIYLEAGLWNMLKVLDESAGSQSIELLSDDIRQLILLYVLQNKAEELNEFSLIRNYLLNSNKEKREGYVKHVWQLSKKLAIYFREYEYHRPDMVKQWLEVTSDFQHKPDEIELFQRYIYNMMHDPVNGFCADINGKQFVTLTQYASKVFNNKKVKMDLLDVNEVQKNIHIFGLSQVSEFHERLIGRLGEYFNVNIYVFNPCCEFWEDVETFGEQRWRIAKMKQSFKVTDDENPAGELKDTDNLLLQWWGKPGRENIRLLSALTDYNFYELFSLNDIHAISSDTVLQRLQRNILHRTPSGDRESAHLQQDCSVQVVGCPGLYREVETVYNSIIYNMNNDKTLKLTDIAILVPDMGKYKTAITSVFSRLPSHIPYNLCDSTAEKESVFGQAVINLLKLAEGTFSRKEVFSVVFNPCFLSKFNLNRDDVNIWADWADKLNIFHSFDAGDRERHGYSADSTHTWRHGLRRLRMARIMDTHNDDHISGRFEDYMGIVPFDIAVNGNKALLGKFCEVIELLFARIQTLRDGKLSCTAWGECVRRLVDEFLSIPDEHASEARVRQSLFESLNDLEIYDKLLSGNTTSAQENKDEYFEPGMIMEFIKSRLMSIPSSYGSYLTGGVTISEMQPMRPIPFRIVYVMGMGESEFPGRANQSTLDLRIKKRKIGDVSRPETNCYMFLEILVSTLEKLYLTFVSKDLQNEEEFIPCSVIHQLIQYIEAEVLQDKVSFEITYVPLKGSDSIYLAKNGAKKEFEISDVIVNYSETDRLSCYVENGLLDEAKSSLNDAALKRVERFDPDFHISEVAGTSGGEAEKITLQQLKGFLGNPVEAGIKRHLNLYEDDNEDKSMAENEPFFEEFPLDYNIIIDSMRYCVNSTFGNSLADVETVTMDFLENYYRSSLLKGMTPVADFAVVGKEEFKIKLKDRFPVLLDIIKQINESRRRHQWIFFGDGNLKDAGNKKSGEFIGFDSFRLGLDVKENDGSVTGNQIAIHGSLPVIWQNNEGWHSLVLTTRKKQVGKLPEKYVIEPFLFYLLSLAVKDSANLFCDCPFTVHVLYKEELKSWRYELLPEKAIGYFNVLAADYLNRKQFDFIPFASVKKTMERFNSNRDKGDLFADVDSARFKAALEEDIAANDWLSELPDMVKLTKAEVPEDVFGKVQQRFSFFF
ncbi:MAG: exodeoxyribonuclease V subunit gamma, partial [Candidatus Anammoxibacter sp.]